MIRQALTTLICSVTFFLIVFVIPVQAEHMPASVPYVCTSLEDAMETARLQVAEDMETMKRRARTDNDFKCFFFTQRQKIFLIELVHEYTAHGVAKGIVRVRGPNGSDAYTFGTMKFINEYLHEEGV